MAVEKLSQIAVIPPTAVTDQVIGLIGGTTDALFAISQIGALSLTQPLVFYVATTGADSNSGSLIAPFATLNHALEQLINYDFRGLFGWTINIADGTYTENTGTAWVVPPCKNCVSGQINFSASGNASNLIFLNAGGFEHQGFYILVLNGSVTMDMYIQNSDVLLSFTGFVSPSIHNNILYSTGTLAVDATNVPFALVNFINISGGGTFDSGVGFVLAFNGSAWGSLANAAAACVINLDFSIVFPAISFALNSAFQISQGAPNINWIPSLTNATFVTGGGIQDLAFDSYANINSQNGVASDILGGIAGQPPDPTISWGEFLHSSGTGIQVISKGAAPRPARDLVPSGHFVWKDTRQVTGFGAYVVTNDAGTITYLTPIGEYLVSTLPAGLPAGTAAFVTDATAPTFAALLTGLGGVFCPVYYDGTNWRAG